MKGRGEDSKCSQPIVLKLLGKGVPTCSRLLGKQSTPLTRAFVTSIAVVIHTLDVGASNASVLSSVLLLVAVKFSGTQADRQASRHRK